MRPQREAAERLDALRRDFILDRLWMASMRPQREAAERLSMPDARCNLARLEIRFTIERRSAKLRKDEHRNVQVPLESGPISCFNEAAARSCGKTPACRYGVDGVLHRFNEAAARSCGKTSSAGSSANWRCSSFNEAAARSCGKTS